MIITSIIQVGFILPQEFSNNCPSPSRPKSSALNMPLYFFPISDAFNTELFLSCIQNLRRGKAVDIPDYNFKTYKSVPNARKVPL